eukprot:c16394_g1_i1 orf=629-2245(-)
MEMLASSSLFSFPFAPQSRHQIWTRPAFYSSTNSPALFGGLRSNRSREGRVWGVDWPSNVRNRRRQETVVGGSGVSVREEAGANLEVTKILESNSRVNLRVSVPPKICKESYDQVLKDFGQRTKIPGFRSGKYVPESVLVNFVGKEKIKSLAIETVLKNTLPDALSTVAARALKDSEHILTTFDELRASFSPIGILSYDVAVDVVPDIRWTTENAYKNLKVEVEIDDDASIERAVEAEFMSRYKDLGSLRIVLDRGIQVGDVVILDISATHLKEDGTEGDRILSAEQKDFQLDTDVRVLPGFVDSILGLERDQCRSFDLVFPQDWVQESLRGVTAQFTVQCKELFYRVLPDLDDSLAERLHENCRSLTQVKDALWKKYQDLSKKSMKQATQFAIVQELANVVVIDVPQPLLEEQGRQMYAAKLIELQAGKMLSKDEIFTLSSEEMVNNFLFTQKEMITKAVKQDLAIAEIFKLENMKYLEEELNKEVENAERQFKDYSQEYDRDQVIEQAKEMLEAAKVLEWLTTHADITYIARKRSD